MAVSAPIVKCPCCGKVHLALTPQVISELVAAIKAQGKEQYLVSAMMGAGPPVHPTVPFSLGNIFKR